MRKKFVWLLAGVMVVSAMMLGGCGAGEKVTAQSLMEESNANMEKVKSITGDMEMKMNMNISAEGYGMDIGMSMNGPIEMVMDSQTLHMPMTMNMNLMGQEMAVDMDMYTQVEGDQVVTYTGAEGQWMKTVTDAGENSDLLHSTYAMVGDGVDMTLAEATEKVGDKEVYVLTAVISGDKLQSLMDQTGAMDTEIDLDLSALQANATVKIYKDTILPASVYIELVQGEEEIEMEGATVKYNEMTVTLNYTAYDTIDSITIPEEALAAETISSDAA